MRRGLKLVWFSATFVVFAANLLWALAAGSLCGVLTDPSGATVPRADVTVVNTGLKSQFKASSDARGFYSFPALPVGHYDLIIEAQGFQTQKKTDIVVDADSAFRIDALMQIRQRTDQVTVSASVAGADTVETISTTSAKSFIPRRWSHFL